MQRTGPKLQKLLRFFLEITSSAFLGVDWGIERNPVPPKPFRNESLAVAASSWS